MSANVAGGWALVTGACSGIGLEIALYGSSKWYLCGFAASLYLCASRWESLELLLKPWPRR